MLHLTNMKTPYAHRRHRCPHSNTASTNKWQHTSLVDEDATMYTTSEQHSAYKTHQQQSKYSSSEMQQRIASDHQ